MNPTGMKTNMVNGIDVEALKGVAEACMADPAQAQTHWAVETNWVTGMRSDTKVTDVTIGGTKVERPFLLKMDEPVELMGMGHYANPQEHLLAALNACMTVGYAAQCTLAGIEIESLRIETEGDIDLRGFLGDPEVPPGYTELNYRVTIKSNGTEEQLRKVHEAVMATSPNRFIIGTAVKLNSELVMG